MINKQKIKLAVRYPRQAFRQIFGTSQDGLKYCQMFVTTKCNSRCSFCCFGQMRGSGENMPRSICLEALMQLNYYKPIVKFIGGEPLIWPHLFECVSFASDLGMMPNITTNGIALERVAAELVRCKTAIINISVDGINEEQMALRNCIPGTFEKLISGVQAILSKRVNGIPYVNAHTIITKNNWHSVNAINELVNELGFDEHHIAPYAFYLPEHEEKARKEGALFMTGQEVKGATDLLSYEEWAESVRQLEMIVRESRIPVQINTKCLQKEHCTFVSAKKMTCNRYTEEINIKPDGDAGICNGAIKIGNIISDDLRDIWMNEKHRKFIASFGNGKNMCFRCCGAQLSF